MGVSVGVGGWVAGGWGRSVAPAGKEALLVVKGEDGVEVEAGLMRCRGKGRGRVTSWKRGGGEVLGDISRDGGKARRERREAIGDLVGDDDCAIELTG